MEVDQYLIPALNALHTLGEQPGVVVIDEPDSFGDPALLARQATVLKLATANHWPVWFITLNNVPLHSTLRTAAPAAVTFTKPRGNAFEVVGFRQAVRTAGVRRLVVMGHESNMCVKLSVTGGKWNPHDPADTPTLGAIGYGYEVWTCQAVLSGAPANWKTAATLIKFHRGLKPLPLPPTIPHHIVT
jgi:nicotinamidase-related amidase